MMINPIRDAVETSRELLSDHWKERIKDDAYLGHLIQIGHPDAIAMLELIAEHYGFPISLEVFEYFTLPF